MVERIKPWKYFPKPKPSKENYISHLYVSFVSYSMRRCSANVLIG